MTLLVVALLLVSYRLIQEIKLRRAAEREIELERATTALAKRRVFRLAQELEICQRAANKSAENVTQLMWRVPKKK